MGNALGPGSANEQEIIRLMDQYGSMLSSLCRMLLKDYHRAQDAVQETYIKAYRHVNQLARIQNEKAWLTRIAVNICRDMMRTAWFRNTARSIDLSSLPEIPAPENMPDEDSTILNAVQELAPKEREVLLLHYWQELDVNEIASILSVNRATVYRRLERARQRLRLNMEGGLRHD